MGRGASQRFHKRRALPSLEAGAGLKRHHHPVSLQHLPVASNSSPSSSADTARRLPGGSASPGATVKLRERGQRSRVPGPRRRLALPRPLAGWHLLPRRGCEAFFPSHSKAGFLSWSHYTKPEMPLPLYVFLIHPSAKHRNHKRI